MKLPDSIPKGAFPLGPLVGRAGEGGWYSASDRTLFLFVLKVLFLGQSSSPPLSREDGGLGDMSGACYSAISKTGVPPKYKGRSSRKKG